MPEPTSREQTFDERAIRHPASDREGGFAASPHELYEQTGGGDAYRVAMLEHGYVEPTAPWRRKPEPGSGRALQCGLTHEFNWSEWRVYEDGGRRFLGRFCRTCSTTQAREAGQERDV